MQYPALLLAIRLSRCPQYEIAQRAGIREGRLSEIVRRGGAKESERSALSRALGFSERSLFRSLAPHKSESKSAKAVAARSAESR